MNVCITWRERWQADDDGQIQRKSLPDSTAMHSSGADGTRYTVIPHNGSTSRCCSSRSNNKNERQCITLRCQHLLIKNMSSYITPKQLFSLAEVYHDQVFICLFHTRKHHNFKNQQQNITILTNANSTNTHVFPNQT